MSKRSRFFFLWLFILLVIARGPASATEPNSQAQRRELRQVAREDSAVLQREFGPMLGLLLQQGVTRIGALDIRELQNDFRAVKFYIHYSENIMHGSGYRTGCVNFVEQREVYCNGIFIRQPPLARFHTVILHEVLGALGWDDEDYGLSTALLFVFSVNLSHPGQGTEFLNQGAFDSLNHITRTQRNRRYQLADGGSGTTVGGGGDPTESHVKLALLSTAFAIWQIPEYRELFRAAMSRVSLARMIDAIIQLRIRMPYQSRAPDGFVPDRDLITYQIMDRYTQWSNEGGVLTLSLYSDYWDWVQETHSAEAQRSAAAGQVHSRSTYPIYLLFRLFQRLSE